MLATLRHLRPLALLMAVALGAGPAAAVCGHLAMEMDAVEAGATAMESAHGAAPMAHAVPTAHEATPPEAPPCHDAPEPPAPPTDGHDCASACCTAQAPAPEPQAPAPSASVADVPAPLAVPVEAPAAPTSPVPEAAPPPPPERLHVVFQRFLI